MDSYLLEPIGWIRSELKNTKDAPRFYTEGAPNARLELDARVGAAMEGIKVGDEIVVITWLHLANRETLRFIHAAISLARKEECFRRVRRIARIRWGFTARRFWRSIKMSCPSAPSRRSTERPWWTLSALSKSRLMISPTLCRRGSLRAD